MGKVLFVIAPSDFRDEELFQTQEVIRNAGYETTIASTTKSEARGMLGGRAKPNLLISEVNISEYKAVIFVGGQGVETHKLPENPAVIKIAKEANAAGKVVGAICIAPRILASADLVRGKKVTSFGDSETIAALREAGGNYTGRSVEVDGRIVTADGPSSARKFGEKIIEVLEG
ncbi:MAG: DJ-1/PfpI family protein [Candidatus Micrarchaeia archaeon]